MGAMTKRRSKRCAALENKARRLAAVRFVLYLAPRMRTRRIRHSISRDEDDIMLFTIAVVLLVLWVMGFVAFHVTTGFIHLLLLAAVVAVVFQLVAGRRAI
jgi:hypothetical protein